MWNTAPVFAAVKKFHQNNDRNQPDFVNLSHATPPVPTVVHHGGITVDHTPAINDSQIRRHGAHLFERSVLLKALPEINTTEKGKKRFENCGQRAVLQYNASTCTYRVTSRTCGHRWCPACRAAFVRDVRAKLRVGMHKAAPYAFKFITLTLRSSTDTLADQINLLWKSFRKLRQTTLWKRRIQWGVAIVEVTLNHDTKLWHPHLHIIAKGAYLPHKALSKAWNQATNGSPICVIKAVKNAQGAISYVTKYITKGTLQMSGEDPAESAAEAINALKRKKTIIWFGNKPDLTETSEGSSEDQQNSTWTNVCTLGWLIHLKRQGDANATAVLRQLDDAGEKLPLFDNLRTREDPYS